MAAKYLICYYCGEKFDRNTVPHVPVKGNRYAHRTCAEEYGKDELELDELIREIFNTERINPKITKQKNTFVGQNDYTFKGISNALKFFFIVKNNSIEKANGGIGIVPWVYDEAQSYFARQEEIYSQQKNIELEPTEKVTISINKPQRRQRGHGFNFLEEESE